MTLPAGMKDTPSSSCHSAHFFLDKNNCRFGLIADLFSFKIFGLLCDWGCDF